MKPAHDRFAKYYDRALVPLERWFLAKARDEAAGYIPKGASLLELGAGTGANFQYYPPFDQAVATELSGEMLHFAKPRQNGVALVQADAQMLPFPDSYFDAAFATLVFCSVRDPAAAFAEVMRVVRPSGSFVMLEHVRPPGMLGKIFDAANVLTVAAIDDHFNRETARAAANAGLCVERVISKLAGAVNLIICKVPSEFSAKL